MEQVLALARAGGDIREPHAHLRDLPFDGHVVLDAVRNSEISFERARQGNRGGACNSIGKYDRQRSEEHTSELQSHLNLVCRLLLEKKNSRPYDLETILSRSRPHIHP